MLSGYVERGITYEVVNLFITIRLQDIKLDERTLCILLPLCVKLANGLRIGQSLQAHAIKCGMEDNTPIRSTLLSLFGEINCVKFALKIFN